MSRGMLKIGLTGNVGAGKSSVAEIWSRERGACIIDADALGREAVQPGQPALAELEKRFGPGVLNPDGSLNRREMGRVAFSSAGELQALNRIVHPYIMRRIEEQMEEAERAGSEVCVVDAALIYEFGLDKKLDGVVVVDATAKQRRERVLAKGKMDGPIFELVISIQLPAQELRRRGDWIIENDGGLEALRARAIEVFDMLIKLDEKY